MHSCISNHDSFQLSFKKETSHGLSFTVNYTASKALDAATSPGWCCASDTWQNAYDWRANYGLALMDIPQLLSGSFIYELPFGSGKALLNRGGIVNGILGGWQLSSTFQLHSGLPYSTPPAIRKRSATTEGFR